MSQSKVGSQLGGSGRQESKAGPVSQLGKEKGSGVAHFQAARRGNMLISRAARVKVWEERIEEEEEIAEEYLEETRVQQEQANCIIKGKVRGSMQMTASRAQQAAVVGGGSKTKKSTEEIGVFDAERYFGGAEQPGAGWAREEEDELMDGEAGGDLPLSPLVEFGKGQLWRWRSDGAASAAHDRRGAGPSWAATTAPGRSTGRRRVESSEFTSPRTSTASSLSEVEPPPLQRSHALLYPTSANGKPGKNNKVQPASPSGRLANFLAKFKAPTPRKSPAAPCSPIQPAAPPRRAPAAPSVLSPAKKLFPHYSLGGVGLPAAQAKTSASPRGRFLRAFSSSSADNSASAVSLRHHSNNSVINAGNCPPSLPAASSPVSPAARSAPDPYSPVAHSASTTPTSSRLPRSSAQYSNYSHHQYGSSTSSVRSKPADSAGLGHCNSSSGSLKQQLPSLSRKLKVYLMPDKAGAANSGKHDKSPAGKTGAAQGQDFGVLRHAKQYTQEKQRRRWLHAEDQVVDEDIELAERLLRVVQDHQAVGMSQHSKFSLLSQAINGSCSVNKSNYSSSNIKGLYVDRVSEYSTRKYDQMHPATISATSNLVPAAAAAHSNGAVTSCSIRAAGPHLQYFMSNPDLQLPAAAKDQEAPSQQVLYDSDSSSDLFEIEGTLASSVGMGLYTRRNLPVYEAKEAPFPNHSFSFASSATAARPARS